MRLCIISASERAATQDLSNYVPRMKISVRLLN